MKPTPASLNRPLSADIFCRIVDNYGDIGVCWRLAKQLSHEHGVSVRLFIDHPQVAQKLIPELDTAQNYPQVVQHISLYHWHEPMPEIMLADMVIEAFACDMPAHYLATLDNDHHTWINLEYLSCEKWVDEMHLLPSPHPTRPITKTFFMPGFTAKTGGLLREKNLMARRDHFLASTEAQTEFLERLGLTTQSDTCKISLFCYAHAPLRALIDGLMDVPTPTKLLIPEGAALHTLQSWPEFSSLSSGKPVRQGPLTVYALPFLTQDEYDQLLWCCDINIVRGEDSWIRAIWANKPILWQPYLQDPTTTATKQDAFLQHYAPEPQDSALMALIALNRGFVSGQIEKNHLKTLLGHLSSLKNHAQCYCNNLLQQPDLTGQLIEYHLKKRQ